MIDAHKNAIVSREQLILKRVFDKSLPTSSAFKTIISASESYTNKKRPHKGSKTNHLVPNQYNGCAEKLIVIGDKHGYGVTSYINKFSYFISISEKNLGFQSISSTSIVTLTM